MKLNYSSCELLPPLAWVARWCSGCRVVDVVDGCYVETRPSLFIEGPWAGDFLAEGPHRCDTVFGTGGVLENDAVTFVNCTATIDRLHLRYEGGRLTISNSLPLLLAMLDDALRDNESGYRALNDRMLDGLASRDAPIPTRRGSVRRILHCNVRVNGGVHIVDKPAPPPFQHLRRTPRLPGRARPRAPCKRPGRIAVEADGGVLDAVERLRFDRRQRARSDGGTHRPRRGGWGSTEKRSTGSASSSFLPATPPTRLEHARDYPRTSTLRKGAPRALEASHPFHLTCQ